jgi:tetratricopeptide (TPR) repeat protein
VKKVPAGPAAPPRSALMAFWDKHGNRILLGVTVLLLLWALFRYRENAAERATVVAWENLHAAQEKVKQFRSPDLMRLPPEQIMQEARSLESGADSALDAVITDRDQSKLLSQALTTRGDLYWTLANLPEPQEAATQPALKLNKPSSAYLEKSQEAYKAAIAANTDPVSVLSAKFGLAAVYENKKDWDAAKKLYDEIERDATNFPSLKTVATVRVGILDNLRRPLYVSASAQPVAATLPTTSATQPTTMPIAVERPATTQSGEVK